jgi:predicted ATP-dependent protease
LALNASLVFEQSYGHVDGDSASVAELCALLSALSGVPIRQSIAITGSVNQHGSVQAIGGVNEKIEGFYDVCAARGLTGDQGVIIPASNVKHLMLRSDVVAAVAAGRFHVWTVDAVDDAVELLMGMPAGAPDAKGEYPAHSVNRKVSDELARLAKLQKELDNGQRKAGGTANTVEPVADDVEAS